jgi:Cu(I)/Ag(I) efflux system membrane fusion protein
LHSIALLGIAALLASACGGGRPPKSEPLLTTDAGSFSWQVWLDPDPAQEKGNHLWLRVRDSRDQLVEGAEVGVEYLMPAMGQMAEMRGAGKVADRGDGWYEVQLDFSMKGTWTVSVAVEAAGALGEADYAVTTGAKGLRQTSASAGGKGGAAASGKTTGEATVALKIEPLQLPGPARDSLRTALAAYAGAHELLAADRLDGLAARAQRIALALAATQQALSADPVSAVARCLAEGADAARAMGAAKDLAAARAAFGEVSRFLLALAAADDELSAGWHVFECPMTETFPKWMQRSERLVNPYMGKAMSSCGNPSDWTVPAPASMVEAQAHADAAHGGDIAYYTCSMHTSVRSDRPGKCPLCSMNLVPVTRQESTTGVIRIEDQRRQEIGVVTARAERRGLVVPVRAVGKVVVDQTKLADVTVKYQGWIETLYVAEPGQLVRRGQPLFALYSPELLAAQHEYLAALGSQAEARSSGVPDRADYLVAAARQKLRLWDLTPGQIERLGRTRQPVTSIPILATVSGYVVEKEVVEGSAVEPGKRLFRLAGLDEVWVEAEVYESELPLLSIGDSALVTFPYLPGRTFTGTIAFVYPYLDPGSRTGRVRVRLPNPGGDLKPDMYANVSLGKALGERLALPEQAVLYAGERQFVFVDLGEGRLVPRRVTLGQRAGEWVEVLAGLQAGEMVVTSGTFLVAAEARLKLPMEQWR